MTKNWWNSRTEGDSPTARTPSSALDSVVNLAATALATSVPRSLELADWIYAAGLAAKGWHQVTRVLAAAMGSTRCWLVAEAAGCSRIVAASDLAVTTSTEPSGAGSEWAGDPPGAAAIDLGGDEALRLIFDRAPFAAEERDFVRMVGRHIVRSRMLARTLARAEARGQLAAAALDRMAMGVVILDGEGRVAHLNPAARKVLEKESAVELVSDRLNFAQPALERALMALRQRSPETSERRRLAAELLRLPRSGQRAALEILAISLEGLDLAEGGAALALFLSDPERTGDTPATILSGLYGLTAAEARVAGEVLRGSGIDETADNLGLKRETIRTHLKHIFAKVGTTRQADLVRLLLTGAAGVRWE